MAHPPVFEVAVESSFDFLSAEYATLYEASAATAFQHPIWLSALYERLVAHNRATPLIVVIRRASDRSLAMVLPLVKRRYGALKVVEFADLRVSDYVAAVTDRSTFVAILADTGLKRQVRKALGAHDLLRIGKLGDDALPMHRVLGIVDPQAMATNSYAVPLEASFDDWLARHMDPSYARELAKKGRQLSRKGELKFELATGEEAIAQTFEALRIFRRDRFEANGGGELLQVPAYFDFYTAVARRTDFARTYLMTLDGKPIAGALGLVHKGTFLVILGGFTQTEHKNKSIGSLMFQEVARDCIARGDLLLDFTIGDEPYKMTFGAKPSPMWQMSRAGSPLGYAAALLVARLPAARALARSVFHLAGDRKQQAKSAAGTVETTIDEERAAARP